MTGLHPPGRVTPNEDSTRSSPRQAWECDPLRRAGLFGLVLGGGARPAGRAAREAQPTAAHARIRDGSALQSRLDRRLKLANASMSVNGTDHVRDEQPDEPGDRQGRSRKPTAEAAIPRRSSRGETPCSYRKRITHAAPCRATFRRYRDTLLGERPGSRHDPAGESRSFPPAADNSDQPIVAAMIAGAQMDGCRPSDRPNPVARSAGAHYPDSAFARGG